LIRKKNCQHVSHSYKVDKKKNWQHVSLSYKLDKKKNSKHVLRIWFKKKLNRDVPFLQVLAANEGADLID
jgi:hypothetical protein